MNKLPEEMKLIISREFNSGEIWVISKVLEKLKSEIQAREKVCFISGESEKLKDLSQQSYSGRSFYVGNKSRNDNFNTRYKRLHDNNKWKFNNNRTSRLNEQRSPDSNKQGMYADNNKCLLSRGYKTRDEKRNTTERKTLFSLF